MSRFHRILVAAMTVGTSCLSIEPTPLRAAATQPPDIAAVQALDRRLRADTKVTAPDVMTIPQLLDRMGETFDQAAAIKSYSITWEEYREGKSSRTGPGQRRVWSYEEHRTDGKRFFKHDKTWGNSIRESDTFIPADDGRWVSWLWDGQTYFCIRCGSRKYFAELAEKQCKTAEERARFLARSIGTVDICHRDMMEGSGTCGFDVYMWRKLYGDSERIDKILRRTDRISLRNRLERVGSSECYVVDAEVAGAGKYSLWIDPNHGYLIANALGAKTPGDTTYGTKGATVSYSISNLRFSMIDAVWVPMEWDAKYEETRAPGYAMNSMSHYKRTEVLLNPKFSDRDFEPNVPNGWSVHVEGDDKRYVWHNGKVVDASGREVADSERRERRQ